MSYYTLELNEVLEILKSKDEELFDFDYTLDDTLSKDELQTMFINHYYFREIGVETISRFKQRLKTLWLEKLREYNIKFKLTSDKLQSDDLLNTYEDNLQDTNRFKATPMSKIQDNRNYNTSITEVTGLHKGYGGSQNIYANVSDIVNNHTEVVNEFINEFETLFMQILY